MPTLLRIAKRAATGGTAAAEPTTRWVHHVDGPAALDLLDWQPDERIAAIVGAWPSRFHAARAHGLGLLPDASVDALVDQYVTEHRAAITLPLN